ncbi:Mitochondrial ribosome small subunit biogenesis protein [Zalaria obscura]|uniref:Mitochondrial ribosome small subunit biogenesis protein n=1 Tax=Zalaria obscura TaxID=2024903 RepID=A0ACC3SLW2_9PEZI
MRLPIRSIQSSFTRRCLVSNPYALPRCRPSEIAPITPLLRGSRCLSITARRFDGASAENANIPAAEDVVAAKETALAARKLPLSCPGCGAPSQTIAPQEAGYYSLTRSGVRNFVKPEKKEEDKVLDEVLNTVDKSVLTRLGLDEGSRPSQQTNEDRATPICDRCHNLIHHHTGVPIFHPTIESIEAIIAESPYKHNHIYHVLDAADFPMSLIPSLQYALNLPRMRTQNRRSKSHVFQRGRVAEVSFIITRSDLLAPKKEQVDHLMPYVREVLRDALGNSGKNVRLGNVRLVSAKRGWWTREVKEDIWDRGGAGWMVGKVNVGKSNLFEVVFPKGRSQDVNLDKLRHEARSGGFGSKPTQRAELKDQEGDKIMGMEESEEKASFSPFAQFPSDLALGEHDQEADTEVDKEASQFFDEDDDASLLPPAQKETAYPVMPIISSLPGTTASPIRVPFGNGKGELIDLPGVARTHLDEYVKPEHKDDLVMKSRISPEQYTIKPGQSLLLGGLIRITPTTPDTVFLAYPFVPLKVHVTATEKALAIERGERDAHVVNMVEESTREKIARAGNFKLKWDVTKTRAGPLTSPVAVKLKADRLPFIVFSTDILVEGVGWVELVAQTRRPTRQRSLPPDDSEDNLRDGGDSEQTVVERPTFAVPEVEVFSPEGKFVDSRPPMNAWLLGGKKSVPKHKQKARPRKSMASLKKSVEGRQRTAATAT